MTTIQLTDDEIAILRQGLVSAAARYRENVQIAKEAYANGEISPDMLEVACAQFTKQADAANVLNVKLINADRVILETDPEEGTAP